MSTKSSLLLTKDNEHWYIEGNARYYEEAKTESAIVIEFDAQHKFEHDSEGLRVIIEEGTELYNILCKAKFPTDDS